MTFCFAFGTDGTRILPAAQAATDPVHMSPWVRIAPDGTITILTVTEMGQGSGTSIPLMIAEEMDADWSKVALDWAPSKPEIYGWPDRSGTRVMTVTGSRAVMMYWNDLRNAGAQVRKVLIANAAEKWGVDSKTLKTEPSVVVDPALGRRLSYGEIASFGKVPATLPAIDKSELKSEKPVPTDRQVGAAARSPAEGQRHGAILDRRPAAGHGLCERAALAGAGQLAGKLERRRHQGDAGRDHDRQAPRRHRCGGRDLRAGHGGAASTQGDLEQG